MIISVSDRIGKFTMHNAYFIIDIDNKEILKNRYGNIGKAVDTKALEYLIKIMEKNDDFTISKKISAMLKEGT